MQACFRFLLTLWLGLGLNQAAQAARVFEDSMAQRALACTACHGEQGRAGPDGYYPRLAGKPAGYLYLQLRNFKEGRRHYPPMTGLLDTLDDAYLHTLADYFSGLSLPYPAPRPGASNPQEQERGRELVQEGDRARGLPACTQCHGLLLTGVNPATPGLLGLPADYLNAQLGGWQTGQRHALEPDCMAKIAKQLSASETHAIARWLSAQPVSANARPADHRPAATPARELQCGSDAALGPQAGAAKVRSTATAPAAAAAPAPATNQATAPAQAPIARGQYLARIGNCALCHSARGGMEYAGGRVLDTPFGAVLSSNITPDPAQGIGRWTADDFWRALHEGLSKDGHALYPAFPYTSYTRISRADSDALFAYLKTVAPASQARQPHRLRWPYSSPWALRVWRSLFFKPFESQDQPMAHASPAGAATSNGDALQRGAYLVQGLGHCMECHGARNRLGALSDTNKPQAGGGLLPGSPWLAPSLSDPGGASVAGWSVAEIAAFLQTGRNDRALASGPMAEVVLHGTQYLSDADASAMARYLKALPQLPAQAAPAPANSRAQQGAQLYEKHCADCHGLQGAGRAGAYPALAGNRTVTQTPPNNLIATVLGGGFAPATHGNPRPYGMPPFVLQLNDTEMAALLSHIRSAWGNRAPAISEFDINQLRRAQAR